MKRATVTAPYNGSFSWLENGPFDTIALFTASEVCESVAAITYAFTGQNIRLVFRLAIVFDAPHLELVDILVLFSLPGCHFSIFIKNRKLVLVRKPCLIFLNVIFRLDLCLNILPIFCSS